MVKLKEKEIAKHVKEYFKIFWKYVTSKTRNKGGIGDLYKSKEKTEKATNTKVKANLLSEHFAGILIQESDGDHPTATPREAPRLHSVETTQDKIIYVICKLKRNKSPDPDGIHQRILMELMGALLNSLAIPYNNSVQEFSAGGIENTSCHSYF